MSKLPHENEEQPLTVKNEMQGRFCYVSGSGKVVFDKCPSDQDHLKAPATNETQPLYSCRMYFDAIIPPEWLNKHGLLKVATYTTEKKKVISITFIPES